MGMEYELKFRATEDVQNRLGAAYAGWQTLNMETTYYDTPARALSERRYTLRKRLENGIPVCTVKVPAGDNARGEWETVCDTIEEAIPILCKLGAPHELEILAQEGLAPLCGARFTRRFLTISFGDSLLELALDHGVLFGSSGELPLCEIEVELKKGSVEDANTFGKILLQKYDLTVEPKSKFQRAKELCL